MFVHELGAPGGDPPGERAAALWAHMEVNVLVNGPRHHLSPGPGHEDIDPLEEGREVALHRPEGATLADDDLSIAAHHEEVHSPEPNIRA